MLLLDVLVLRGKTVKHKCLLVCVPVMSSVECVCFKLGYKYIIYLHFCLVVRCTCIVVVKYGVIFLLFRLVYSSLSSKILLTLCSVCISCGFGLLNGVRCCHKVIFKSVAYVYVRYINHVTQNMFIV